MLRGLPGWLVISFAIGVAIAIGWIILMVYRGFNRAAEGSLMRAYDGIDHRQTPSEGDVRLVFHTYHGLLLWWEQTEHAVYLRPDDAYLLLARLNRFNLSWGLVSHAALFVPVLSLGNYVAQKRSIRSQARALDF